MAHTVKNIICLYALALFQSSFNADMVFAWIVIVIPKSTAYLLEIGEKRPTPA